MVHLLSIHVPKTAGTSLYKLLEANYPGVVSPSLRREHMHEMQEKQQTIDAYLSPKVAVVHGHITIREAMPLIQRDHPKIIAFLRDPVERVISNYCYFIDLLRHPEQQQQNPQVYALNKHRLHESIYTYAAMEENQNVMSQFLSGIPLDAFYYLGLQSTYAADVAWLAEHLEWSHRTIEQYNVKQHLRQQYIQMDQGLWYFLKKCNAKDVALYEKVLRIRQQKGWGSR